MKEIRRNSSVKSSVRADIYTTKETYYELSNAKILLKNNEITLEYHQ